MTKISCFSALLLSGKKTSKVTRKVADAKKANGNDCPKVKPVEFIDMAATADVGKCCDKTPPCDMKVVTGAVAESLYECSDKYGEQPPTRRNDFDLHARANSMGSNSDGADKDAIGASLDAMLACGRASDPGVGRMTEPASSKLKRSCSNIETKRSSPKALDLPARSRSYDDLKNLTGSFAKETIPNGALDASPASVKTSCTADRVMLKKRSSSQVLPSRSRKLWWKLFLWSHRNLHRPWAARPTVATADAADASDQHGGYTSDTMDGGSTVVDSKNKEVMTDEAPIPNQWVAFSAEASSLDRVNAWVNSLDDGSFCIHEEHDMDHEDGVAGHSSLEIGESSGENHSQVKRRAAEEVSQANSIIRSLSAFSSVAHISGMGLKVIPMISAYSSLRAINLSNNFIVHISPGSLPKVLHSLDLSRNKIANMEGLRELTKLRVLNLSYNRISRIGHGLSNCTAIKELYLAGNKISNVEGLHRLLKLTVLDLSFNKITTTKALGQLVANYSSLLALNLLGNPIQANIGDDALRKAVSGLLPQLTYLNKQTVKPQRAREVATVSVAKAALGNSGWSPRRRTSRRLSQSPSSSVKSRTGEGSSSHRGSRSRSKNRHQCSSLTRK